MPSPKRSSHDHKIGSSEVVECGMGGWIDELGKSLRAIQNPVKKIHGRLHKKRCTAYLSVCLRVLGEADED